MKPHLFPSITAPMSSHSIRCQQDTFLLKALPYLPMTHRLSKTSTAQATGALLALASVQLSILTPHSVTQSCLALCNPMDC